MSQDNKVKANGVVLELLSNGLYKVQLEGDHTIIGHLSGKMRMNNIRVLQGDKIAVEMSPYDMTKGRIVFRGKK